MPAVVRIKRRIDEEPLSAFVLNSKKRRRLDNAADPASAQLGADEGDNVAGSAATVEKDEISTILKFAGTIQEQDNSATTQLARLTKEAAKELVLQKSMRPVGNHTERARQEMRQALHESRFRVVNCLRTTLDDTAADADNSVNQEVTILDIEKQEAAHSAHSGLTTAATSAISATAQSAEQQQQPAPQTTDSDTGYVYDLYLPENEWQVEQADMMDDNYLSIRPFDDLVYEDRFNDDDDDEYDSDDSNNENYYANDYPDEGEGEGDDDDHYMESRNFSDTDDLEIGMHRMRFGTRDGFINTHHSDDSSVPDSENDSSDEDYYFDGDDGEHQRKRHTPNDDGDDVDYYDANDNSDPSDD